MPSATRTTGGPQISANSAAFSQLSTLPPGDRERAVSTLVAIEQSIVETSSDLLANVRRVGGANNLYEVRIDEHIRAALKLKSEEKIELIAIGRKEHLEPYIRTLRGAN